MYLLFAALFIAVLFSVWWIYNTNKHEKELKDREEYWKQRDKELKAKRDEERK